jgi:hypothetical protein
MLEFLIIVLCLISYSATSHASNYMVMVINFYYDINNYHGSKSTIAPQEEIAIHLAADTHLYKIHEIYFPYG